MCSDIQKCAKPCWTEGRSHSVEGLRHALSKRARNLGLSIRPHLASSRTPIRLSDLAIQKFPLAFLSRLFPEIKSKAKGEYLESVDRVVTANWGTSRSAPTALALSLLYPSAREALAAAMRAATAAVPAQKRPLESIFLEGGGNLGAIERSLDVTRLESIKLIEARRKVVLNLLRGTPMHQAMEAFGSGASLAEACSKHGVLPRRPCPLALAQMSSRNPTSRNDPEGAGKEREIAMDRLHFPLLNRLPASFIVAAVRLGGLTLRDRLLVVGPAESASPTAR